MKQRVDGPPRGLGMGSHGKIVNLLLKFLDGWAQKEGLGMTSIDVDDDYFNAVGVLWLKRYQDFRGLTDTGDCGPATRSQMKRDGFDFDELAKDVKELSLFVQPNGDRLFWMRGIGATVDLSTAFSEASRAHRLQRTR